MLTIENDQLVFRFPEVHKDAICRIEFQRTLRIPDDNREYPLPPGRGSFPLSHVDEYKDRVPASWVKHGGAIIPMAQAEALWVRFTSHYPFAVKIAAGKINAVSGEAWTPELQQAGHWETQGAAHDLLARDPQAQAAYEASLRHLEQRRFVPGEQDYVTIPSQPWLDGFNVGKGKVRQFVAMPMGEGYTVEEQLTGEAVHGGLQIIVYPIKPEFYVPPTPSPLRGMLFCASAAMPESAARSFSAKSKSVEMGLGAGGLMKQKIYEDLHGYEKWDQTKREGARCFVHLLNSASYREVTGQEPPAGAPTAADYTKAGLPWFDVYDEYKAAVPGSNKLAKVDSIAALGIKKDEQPLPENAPLPVAPQVIGLGKKTVREGDF